MMICVSSCRHILFEFKILCDGLGARAWLQIVVVGGGGGNTFRRNYRSIFS